MNRALAFLLLLCPLSAGATVSTTHAHVDVVATGSAQSDVPITFQFFTGEHIEVWDCTDSTCASETQLQDGIDYEVTEPSGDLPDTSSLDILSGVTAGHTIRIRRVVPVEQVIDLVTAGRYDVQSLEKGLDLLTMMIQQTQEGTLPASSYTHGNLGGGALHAEVVRGDQNVADSGTCGFICGDKYDEIMDFVEGGGSYLPLAGGDVTGAMSAGSLLYVNTTNHAVGIGQDPDEDVSVGARLLVEWNDPADINQNAVRGAIVARGEVVDSSGAYTTESVEAASNPVASSSQVVDAIFARTAFYGAQVRSGAHTGVRTNVNDNSTASNSLAIGFSSVVAKAASSGTLAVATGLKARVQSSTSGGTITDARGIHVEDGVETGTITNRVGIVVEEQAGATNNTDLLLGTTTVPAGTNYALYSASSRESHYVGPVSIAGATTLGGNVGFYGASAAAKPTISGPLGSSVAQQSIVAALAATGYALDSTTAAYAALTYTPSISITATAGAIFSVTATDAVPFSIGAPSSPATGQRITIQIRNTSGGALGTVTWNAVYKMASWTSPATANSRSIDFFYNGTNWIEVGRTTADVPN
jgi:hypothetical protein